MNVIDTITQELYKHIQSICGTHCTAPAIKTTINTDEQRQAFGDISCNAPLILAKNLEKNPRVLAQTIAESFTHPAVMRIDVAGAGFLNIFLTNKAYCNLLQELEAQGETFFKPNHLEKKQYSIEFVSANPTGPLHFGHGRGGIIGDVLGNVIAFIGHQTTKEFYLNDAGAQITKLGESFKARCLQQLGNPASLPEDGYQGEYLVTLAAACVQEYGAALTKHDDVFFATYAKDHLLAQQKQTLKAYGIVFDVWFSEKTLHESNAIQEAVEVLTQRGYTYELDGALWFKSTQFGDDKDRVVRKADGQWTYVAADIAYMRNKIQRGAQHVVMVLGQDHHGYVQRIHGIQQALGLEAYPIDITLFQLVSLSEKGQKLRMSKRAGRMVTLQDIIDEVGKDVARFFFLHRKADAHLDFDLELALKKTEENPVYYLHYAYVRINSILEKAKEIEAFRIVTGADAAALTQSEHLLLKKIVSLKELLLNIATTYNTHQLTYYALELAQLFHSYYGAHKVIDPTNVAQSRARLLVARQVHRTLALCLHILGLEAPHRM